MRNEHVVGKVSGRIGYIDGIRGWAAVVVLLFHVFWETFGAVLPAFRSDHLRFVFAGPLAVFVFFVLSGDALATPFLQTGRVNHLVSIAVRRYFRLAIPVVLASFVVYALMAMSATKNLEAAPLLHRQDWMGRHLTFAPSFAGMLQFSTFAVFATPNHTESYHPFLWTMPIEMLGSLLVFLFLFLCRSFRNPFYVAAVVAVFLLFQRSFLGLFFVGVCLSLLRASGTLARLRADRRVRILSAALLVAVYCYYCYGVRGETTATLMAATAILLVVLIYLNTSISALFETSLSGFLGFVSFPIYLVQFPILVSFTSAGAIYLGRSGNLNYGGALLLASGTIGLCIGLGYLFGLLERKMQDIVSCWLVLHVLTGVAPVEPGAGVDGAHAIFR